MATAITIAITPDIATQELLSELFQDHHVAAESGQSRSSKSRYSWNTPLTGATVEICRIVGAVTSRANSSYFIVQGSPADILIGREVLGGNNVCKSVPVLLEIFKSWLLTQFPSLSRSDVDAITEDHCKISRLGVDIAFEMPSDGEAVSTLLALHRHCKITLDYARPLPHKRGMWKKPAPKVTTDGPGRNAFSVMLPYGQLTVRTKHDLDDLPSSLSTVEDIEQRKHATAAIRRVLFFEIDLDLEKFEYEGDGLSLHLPMDHRYWTRAKLPTDPISLIWDEVRYELWLNIALLTERPDEATGNLTWQLQEVLEAYFAGENIARHMHMGFESKDFSKVRNALIDKARVDILIPWPIHRLNLSESLGALLAYENRLDPRNVEELACHALTQDNMDSAIAGLKSAISECIRLCKKKAA